MGAPLEVQVGPTGAKQAVDVEVGASPEGWYILQNRTTEQVASLPDNRKNAGANIVQVPFDKDRPDQQWRPLWLDSSRFVIVNRRSGLALAVAYGAMHSGATICQWPLHIDWLQHQWRIEVAELQ